MSLAEHLDAAWDLLGYPCDCGCETCQDRAELATEAKRGQMDPFKRKAKLGPGPYGRKVAKRRADRFKCKCTSVGTGSLCKCKSRRRNKTVFVDASYKHSYNTAYRKWIKKRKRTRHTKPKSFVVRTAQR